ncbi:MAG: SCP2 sterol-binding domain-containing protein [Deltaproteobacteria bacterium]|nr:SCP2 sterol-binding domain-containing protein [Deltaproteobacteria bacterium]
MAEFPSKAWFQALQARVNQDQEFQDAARWFNGRVGWQVDEEAFSLAIDRSGVTEVAEGLGRDAFIMAGPRAAWDELLAKGTINRLFRQGKIAILGDKVAAMRFWKILWYLTENARAL